MSGIEVAGLVLGALPLVIAALEHYAEGANTMRTWWRYERELKDMARVVHAYYLFYKDTCTTLLNNIAPPKKISLLLDDLGGKAWEDADLQKELKRFLADSFDVYKATIQSMDAVVSEFKRKLRLGPDGKVSSRVCHSFRQSLIVGLSPSGKKTGLSGRHTRHSSSVS